MLSMCASPRLRFDALLLAVVLSATYALADGIDFIVYQDGSAGGKLALAKPEQVDEPYRILPATVDELPGYYLSIDPGWDGLGVTDESTGRFALAERTQISLRRVGFDTGFFSRQSRTRLSGETISMIRSVGGLGNWLASHVQC